MSLSENFISDIVGGDNFLIALTATGEVFFVDDSLEAVQINTLPITSIAVAGSKIVGISNADKLYEWSTSGLNKLSFNKENKLLLRQDFQIKEYNLKAEFSQNAKLCSLPFSKTTSALLFKDAAQVL